MSTIGGWQCEVCWDAMTDAEVAAAESPTGVAMAVCEGCQGKARWKRWVCAGDFAEAHGFLREKHLDGTLARWEVTVVGAAADLRGLRKPVVYLVGRYAQREDWGAMEAALAACEARCYWAAWERWRA